ncbi:hypothetical protein AOLI_G00274190 [Acnodon oligacanthus]
MPISSGAAGRWGAENKTQGSYLKMYLGTLPQEKRMLLENTLEAECISGAAREKEDVPSEGVQKEKQTEQRWLSDGYANGGQIEQTPPNKSSTCTVL